MEESFPNFTCNKELVSRLYKELKQKKKKKPTTQLKWAQLNEEMF